MVNLWWWLGTGNMHDTQASRGSLFVKGILQRGVHIILLLQSIQRNLYGSCETVEASG